MISDGKWKITRKCMDRILNGDNPFMGGYVHGAIMVTYDHGRVRFDFQDGKRDVIATMELDYFPGSTAHIEGLEIQLRVTLDEYPLTSEDLEIIPGSIVCGFDEWNW